MCGITGYASFKGRPTITQDVLDQMVDTLYHRGPDESGMDIVGGIAMGMRRLAIIDLSGGTQPIWNEDRTIWTVYNGEIYNFKQIRSELENKGHVFKTNTDTEVIVHAYEEYGMDFPKQLDGMFAIALHDTRAGKLILVRDHLGIKPFYYSFTKDRIVFGSEIKSLLASGEIEKTLDFNSLNEFLTWEYVPGEGTLFQSIRKLEPASYLEIDLDSPKLRPQRYWEIPHGTPKDDLVSREKWQDSVDDAIRNSVINQLISDVPLGAFLSGGVDSSLVVSSMGPAQTFSIGFDDPTYNELNWAKRVADHLGVDHKDEVIQPDVLDLYHLLMTFMDDPIGDFSIFPTYLVSKLARKHVTVSLSGDGGDELFGGYETYLAQFKAAQYHKIPAFLRSGVIQPLARLVRPTAKKKGLINKAKRFLEGMEYSPTLGHARWRVFMSELLAQNLFTNDAWDHIQRPATSHIEKLFNEAGNRGDLNRTLYVDVKSYLVDNCLTKVDRMSMATSLESRVPFLSPNVVELAFRLPERYKVGASETKILLKEVAARHIPKECIYRPKEGFSIPIKKWLTHEFKGLMEDLLEPSKIRADGIFSSDEIERLKKEHLNGVANHSHILWSLMVFHTWKSRWMESN